MALNDEDKDSTRVDGDTQASTDRIYRVHPSGYLVATGEVETPVTRYQFPLEHVRAATGQCQAWCYACERRGLQERVHFTESFDSLRNWVRAYVLAFESGRACNEEYAAMKAVAFSPAKGEPPSDDAVDPQAGSTGKRSTRA